MNKIRIGVLVIKNIKNWERVFLNYFGIINDPYIEYKLRNGKNIPMK